LIPAGEGSTVTERAGSNRPEGCGRACAPSAKAGITLRFVGHTLCKGRERKKTYSKWSGPNHLTADFGEASLENHRTGDVFDRRIGVTRQSERSEA
jgi:hypothetical protein